MNHDFDFEKPVPLRRRLWSLREEVLIEIDGDGMLAVTQWGDFQIDEPGPLVRESLRRMGLGPVSLANVLPGVEPLDGTTTAAHAGDIDQWRRLNRVLKLLSGSVVHSLGADDAQGPLLSAIPVARQAGFRLVGVDPTAPVRLSRFAALRSCGDGLVLESPLSHYRIVLHRTLSASVTAGLGGATTIPELAGQVAAPESTVSHIVCYLATAGMLTVGEYDAESGQPRFAEDADPALLPWSHNDLLFHSRSRLGRHDGPVGAVFPYLDELPPEPAVKDEPEGRRFPLVVPDLTGLPDTDPTITEVIEYRLATRSFSESAPTAEQLGELLYRAARVRSVRHESAGSDVRYEISDRPYPSSSDLYELEIYVVIDRCTGLPRGIYHYNPEEHFITLVNTAVDELDELFDTARITTGISARPPLLISIAARMARISWMYTGTAYALTLKHVGMLQQTLCLVAAAMGLAQCPVSVGDSELASAAFRLTWPTEVNVGELVIGVPST